MSDMLFGPWLIIRPPHANNHRAADVARSRAAATSRAQASPQDSNHLGSYQLMRESLANRRYLVDTLTSRARLECRNAVADTPKTHHVVCWVRDDGAEHAGDVARRERHAQLLALAALRLGLRHHVFVQRHHRVFKRAYDRFAGYVQCKRPYGEVQRPPQSGRLPNWLRAADAAQPGRQETFISLAKRAGSCSSMKLSSGLRRRPAVRTRMKSKYGGKDPHRTSSWCTGFVAPTAAQAPCTSCALHTTVRVSGAAYDRVPDFTIPYRHHMRGDERRASMYSKPSATPATSANLQHRATCT